MANQCFEQSSDPARKAPPGLNVGDRVRYSGPSISEKKRWIGEVVRLPIPRDDLASAVYTGHLSLGQGKEKRTFDAAGAYPGYVIVQVGSEKRARPVYPWHLERI